jgi:hypothetical protein
MPPRNHFEDLRGKPVGLRSCVGTAAAATPRIYLDSRQMKRTMLTTKRKPEAPGSSKPSRACRPGDTVPAPHTCLVMTTLTFKLWPFVFEV